MKIFIYQVNMVEQWIVQIKIQVQIEPKQKQLSYRADRKHLKLNSNLDTRLAHNALGKAKPKYSWQYFTISIFLVVES